MSRVWLERPIASVEDAEALPVGTVVTDGIGAWVGWDDDDTVTFTDGEDSAITPRQMIGWTALVPVEAVEEESLRRVHARGSRDDLLKAKHVRRLVTEWDPS